MFITVFWPSLFDNHSTSLGGVGGKVGALLSGIGRCLRPTQPLPTAKVEVDRLPTMQNDRAWRVGYVEDHTLTAEGLAKIVGDAPDLQWGGSAPTVDALLNLDGDFDVVVLDLWLADGSTPQQNVEKLNSRGIPVLIYTSGEHADLLRSAARAEVLGTLRKKAPVPVVLDAIRSVAQGEEVLAEDWAAALDADPDLPLARLSPQEEQVLTLVASGQDDRGVARRLNIKPETVKVYIKRIRLKYAEIGRTAPSRVDLAVRAIEDGHRAIHRRRR